MRKEVIYVFKNAEDALSMGITNFLPTVGYRFVDNKFIRSSNLDFYKRSFRFKEVPIVYYPYKKVIKQL